MVGDDVTYAVYKRHMEIEEDLGMRLSEMRINEIKMRKKRWE
jgi:hypothetical protein